jgi:hypothetical protein
MENEFEDIAEFIRHFSLSDAIPAMEKDLEKAIGYSQRIGEVYNDAEFAYRNKFAESLDRLGSHEDETETTRRAKLKAWTAEERRVRDNLKVTNTSLKIIRMALMQAIKTRREEPH